MMPSLKPGDRVLVWCSFFRLKRGDLVAIHDPRDQKVIIKRIYSIKNGQYDVRGDNNLHSTDSRNFGMIRKTAIIGKIIFVL